MNRFTAAMDRLRRAEQRDTAARDSAAAAQRNHLIGKFGQVCAIVGDMRTAGVCFPAGAPPSFAEAAIIAGRSAGTPRLEIPIDTRRSIVLSCTPQGLYRLLIWELSTAHDELVTDSLDAVANWLVNQCHQYGVMTSRRSPGQAVIPRFGMPPASPALSVPPEDEPSTGHTGEATDKASSDGRPLRSINLKE